MHPVLTKFFFINKEITIGSYGLVMVVSLLLCTFLVLFLAKTKKYIISDIIDYLLIIFSGGFLSALIIGLLYTNGIEKIHGMYSLPLISWGGFIGGIIVVIIFNLTWKTEIFKLLDLISPGYTLALSIGRIGCFMGGCCYGRHTDSSWGVYFTHYMAPASQKLQPLIPVQLISSILLIILTMLLVYIYIKSNSPGNTFITFIIIYSISRFSIEFFRDDSRHFFLNLSDGQIYSILLFVTGILLLLRKNLIIIYNKVLNRIN